MPEPVPRSRTVRQRTAAAKLARRTASMEYRYPRAGWWIEQTGTVLSSSLGPSASAV
jgi:hypothetical protein